MEAHLPPCSSLCPPRPTCPAGLVVVAAWTGAHADPSRLSFDPSLSALYTAGGQYMLCSCWVVPQCGCTAGRGLLSPQEVWRRVSRQRRTALSSQLPRASATSWGAAEVPARPCSSRCCSESGRTLGNKDNCFWDSRKPFQGRGPVGRKPTEGGPQGPAGGWELAESSQPRGWCVLCPRHV